MYYLQFVIINSDVFIWPIWIVGCHVYVIVLKILAVIHKLAVITRMDYLYN